MTSFEFPVTERTRTLLRLEQVYQRLAFFIAQDEPFQHHAALMVLFEVLETAGRTELKSELLQELERQKQALEGWRSDPEHDPLAQEQLLDSIELAAQRLLELNCRFGQHLRENEWLMAIKQRAIIPGGTCSFDLPSYHLWLQRPAETRREDLLRWAAPLMPTAEAAAILLRLLRDNGKHFSYVAKSGAFQQMSGGNVVQLIRVSYDSSYQVVPEVSANKYALNIRFVAASTGEIRPKQVAHDIDFTLTFCKF